MKANSRMTRTADSIAEVVTSGLCIGCGLCEAVTKGRVQMQMTAHGGLRPTPADDFSPEEEAQLLKICPGTISEPRTEPGLSQDDVWGAYSSLSYAWAGDPDIRFRAATGGVLTALGMHLLKSGKAQFVLHVGADPERPMRSRWVISETPQQVVANTGSRYGPTSPLAGIETALERRQPFAIIVKPCDLGAVHQLAKTDPRLDEFCVARLAMVCGGQSRLSKSQLVLKEFGLTEDELTVFRYRGYGNPGRTRIETRDGRAFEKTYLELWEDEASWMLETRCKLCPEPLGEAADVAALDVWSGGSPTGEDAGLNGIVVRTAAGQALVESAVASGDLIVGDPLTPDDLNDFQPHQVRKKEALAARYDGFAEAGLPVIDAGKLRLDLLGERISAETRDHQRTGSLKRIQEGRVIEPLPGSEDQTG